MNNRIFGIAEALQSLRPGAEWVLRGDDHSGLEWLSKNIDEPTKQQIETEIKRLQDEYNALSYQRNRAAEYPDFKEYLDGIVKDDQDQINAYIAACLAVKEKYPKPNV